MYANEEKRFPCRGGRGGGLENDKMEKIMQFVAVFMWCE